MNDGTELPDDLLTVNALATAYRVDRRTIERRLRDVKPSRQRRLGGRTMKFYRESEVRPLILAESDAKALSAAYEELHAVRADVLEMRRALRSRECVVAADVLPALEVGLRDARDKALGMVDRAQPEIEAACAKFAADRAALARALHEILDPLVAEIGADLEALGEGGRVN